MNDTIWRRRSILLSLDSNAKCRYRERLRRIGSKWISLKRRNLTTRTYHWCIVFSKEIDTSAYVSGVVCRLLKYLQPVDEMWAQLSGGTLLNIAEYGRRNCVDIRFKYVAKMRCSRRRRKSQSMWYETWWSSDTVCKQVKVNLRRTNVNEMSVRK